MLHYIISIWQNGGIESGPGRSVRVLVVLVLLMLCLTPAGNATAVANAGRLCTAESGQRLIDQGRYEQAMRAFTCVIENQPTAVEGYRGRIEAALLLGQYAAALGDYARVTAFVLPVDPDAEQTIHEGYKARLKSAPRDRVALTGASFARWRAFEYAQAIQLLNRLLVVQPDNLYGNLFRGSSRLLMGTNKSRGIAELEKAIALAPQSADVRFVVADAYTYGLPDPQRALAEATLALDWGLNSPRVQAILASAHSALGDEALAAFHILQHIELVTTEMVTAPALDGGATLTLDFVPGRTYEIAVPATVGERLTVTTNSPDFYDSILVLLAPDGSPVAGEDDYDSYFAGFEWVVTESGSYRLLVTSFESIDTGALEVTRAQ
jgi:tetratricopeptide (TPR) repeat protein